MSVRDIMNSNVETIDPSASLRDAAKRMANNDYGVLPVVDQGDLIGMITDRDICIRAVAEGDDPDNTEVRSVMSEGVITCREDQPVSEVARLMQERQVRRIPVVDNSKNIIGIVTLGDLAVLSEDDMRVAETVEEVSQPLQH